MSSRERWTVYPLLFLTLGIALTDKITQQVRTRQVVCQSLLVTDPGGKPQVIVGQIGSLVGMMFADPNGRIRPSLAIMSVGRKADARRARQAESPPVDPAQPPAAEPQPEDTDASPPAEPK
jgi:hypothetical protein